MKQQHNWTFDEDKLCCQRYVETFVIKQSSIRLSDFVRTLALDLKDIKQTSLRMKVQNIKAIMLERKIADSFSYKSAPNYSKQNWDAMTVVLREMNML